MSEGAISMGDEFDGAGEALNFKYSGRFDKQRRVLLFSPFFPFNVKLIEQFFRDFQDENTVNIYSSIVLNKKYDFNDYLLEFERIIAQVDDNRLVLIGFGFFSFLFMHLAEKHKVKIASLILFEPDFSNQSLIKIFDFEKRLFFNHAYLVKFFCKGRVSKKYLEKGNVKKLKRYFTSSKGYIEKNKTIREMIGEDINPHIFWNVMEKESWPLAQILSEEFELSLYSFNNDIFEVLQNRDQDVMERVKSILG